MRHNGLALGDWVYTQRKAHHEGKLATGRAVALEELPHCSEAGGGATCHGPLTTCIAVRCAGAAQAGSSAPVLHMHAPGGCHPNLSAEHYA